MIRRCTNPSFHMYRWYGGRGIKVCERWTKVENFIADLDHLFAPGLEIDRINNDGNYEPGNVRFVTSAENLRNRESRKDCIENRLVPVREAAGEWCVIAEYDRHGSARTQAYYFNKTVAGFEFKSHKVRLSNPPVFQLLCRECVAVEVA
jgi:hypothetical protein